jgi:hypothetical protein
MLCLLIHGRFVLIADIAIRWPRLQNLGPPTHSLTTSALAPPLLELAPRSLEINSQAPQGRAQGKDLFFRSLARSVSTANWRCSFFQWFATAAAMSGWTPEIG